MAFVEEQFVAERLAKHRAGCKECKGSGRTTVPSVSEDFVVNVPCEWCRSFEERTKQFAKVYSMYVPPRYQGMFLSGLRPTDKVPISAERQQRVLDVLRAEPRASYAFFGPAGTSKTTWLTALWAENAWRWVHSGEKTKWFPVRLVNAKRLLDQFTDWSVHRFDRIDPDSDAPSAEPPTITREKVESWTRQGVRGRLFLEEIDKIGRDTEARKANLFDVVDAVYAHEGQLVMASNLTPRQFEEQFGDVFARRVGEMCKVVNLFEEEK